MVQWGVLLSLDRVVLMWSSLQFFFSNSKNKWQREPGPQWNYIDLNNTKRIQWPWKKMNNIVCFTFLMMKYQIQPTITAKTNFYEFCSFFPLIFRNQNLQFLKKLSFHLLSLRLATPNVWSDIISPKMHVDLIYFI